MIDLDVQENGACETSNEKKAVSQKKIKQKVHAKKSKVEKMGDLSEEQKK